MNNQQSQSGMAWPPALRRRLGIPPSANNNTSLLSDAATMSRQQHHDADYDANDDDSSSDSDNDMMLPPSSNILNAMRMNNLSTESNYNKASLSTHDLRSYIHQCYTKLTSIQRQLHRGEESYYEDTYSRGNLLQGWDNIWIEQQHGNSTAGNNINHSSSNNSAGGAGGNGMLFDSLESSGSETTGGGGNNNATTGNTNSNNNNNSNKQSKSIPIRKMPQDYRWFSSSCTSIVPTMEGDKKLSVLLERTSLVKRPETPEVKEKEIAIVGSSGIIDEKKSVVKKDEGEDALNNNEDATSAAKTTTNDDAVSNESTKAHTQPDVTISSLLCESGGQTNDETPSNIEPAMNVESQSTSKVEPALVKQKQEVPASSNNQSTNIGTIQPDEAPSSSSKLPKSSKPDKVLSTTNQSDYEQSKTTESINIMESETVKEASSSRDNEQSKDSAPMEIEPMVVKGAMKDSAAAVSQNNVSTSATVATTRPNQSGEVEPPGAADTAVPTAPTAVEGNEAAAVNQPPPPYSSLPVAKRARLTKEEGGENSKKGSATATQNSNTAITTTEPSPLSDAAVFGDSPAIPPPPHPTAVANANEEEGKVGISAANKNGDSPVDDTAEDGEDEVQEEYDDDEDTTSNNRRSSRRKRKASS